MKTAIASVISLLAVLVLAAAALADNMGQKQFGDTTIYYSAFNASFIDPQIASVYDITRGPDRGLVNVAALRGESGTGQTAEVSGTVTNLMGQQQTLDFFEIREEDAVYYLAPFRFSNRDPLTFQLEVRTSAEQEAHRIRFQRTLHRD